MFSALFSTCVCCGGFKGCWGQRSRPRQPSQAFLLSPRPVALPRGLAPLAAAVSIAAFYLSGRGEAQGHNPTRTPGEVALSRLCPCGARERRPSGPRRIFPFHVVGEQAGPRACSLHIPTASLSPRAITEEINHAGNTSLPSGFGVCRAHLLIGIRTALVVGEPRSAARCVWSVVLGYRG